MHSRYYQSDPCRPADAALLWSARTFSFLPMVSCFSSHHIGSEQILRKAKTTSQRSMLSTFFEYLAHVVSTARKLATYITTSTPKWSPLSMMLNFSMKSSTLQILHDFLLRVLFLNLYNRYRRIFLYRPAGGLMVLVPDHFWRLFLSFQLAFSVYSSTPFFSVYFFY